MRRADLIQMMVGMLGEALEDEGSHNPGKASAMSRLLGQDAVLSSMGLVTLITDAESVLADEHGVEVTLVSEDAFSRRQSPFRTVEALADYVLELVGLAPGGDREPGGTTSSHV